MDNIIRGRVFGYIKKAAKMLLIFTRNQISTYLIIKTVELVSALIIRIANLAVD